MNKSRAFSVVLSICILGIFFSCATTESGEISETADNTILPLPPGNRLILYETEISLPPGWTFTIPEEEDIFLTFTDKEGFFSGYLEWCSVGFPLSDDELYGYFSENIMDGISIDQKSAVTGSSGSVVLLACTTQTDQKKFHIALIPVNSGFFVLELQEVETSGMDPANVCAQIASSVALTFQQICRRTVLGLYDFHSYSGIWKWMADTSNGGIFYGFLPGWKLCTVTVAVTGEDTLENLLPQVGDYVSFTESVPVNNQEVIADAAGRNLEEGGEVYLLLQGDLNYFLNFTYRDDERSIEYSDLLVMDAIRQFFLAAISFDGIAE